MHEKGDKTKKEFLGRHSSKLYRDIVSAFEFDEFHRPVYREKASKAELMKKLQEEQDAKAKEDAMHAAEVAKAGMFDVDNMKGIVSSDALNAKSGALSGVTFTNFDMVQIGFKPAKFAPPGLAMPQKQVLNSEGHHIYYGVFKGVV